MSRILELQNPNNFSLEYSNSIPATVIEMKKGKNIYAKLTEVIVPVVFDKPVISINIITTVPVGRKWRYAGKLTRVINTALGQSFDESKDLFLGKRNLLFFSQIATDYTVNILFPSWFVDVTIDIYQYDGIDESTAENDISSLLDLIGG